MMAATLSCTLDCTCYILLDNIFALYTLLKHVSYHILLSYGYHWSGVANAHRRRKCILMFIKYLPYSAQGRCSIGIDFHHCTLDNAPSQSSKDIPCFPITKLSCSTKLPCSTTIRAPSAILLLLALLDGCELFDLVHFYVILFAVFIVCSDRLATRSSPTRCPSTD